MLLVTVVTNGVFWPVFFLRFFPLLVGSRITDTDICPDGYRYSEWKILGSASSAVSVFKLETDQKFWISHDPRCLHSSQFPRFLFWWKLWRKQTFFCPMCSMSVFGVNRLCSYVRSWPAWPGNGGPLWARDSTWSSPTLMLRWVCIKRQCREILVSQLDWETVAHREQERLRRVPPYIDAEVSSLKETVTWDFSWPAWLGKCGSSRARDSTWSSPTLMLRWVCIKRQCHEILAGQLDWETVAHCGQETPHGVTLHWCWGECA